MITLVVINDTHINSTAALFPPSFTLDKGNPVQYNPVQRWFWRNWQDLLEKVSNIKGKKIGILNGDILDGDCKDRTFEIISKNPADVLKMGAYVLDPFMKMMDESYFVMGTEAHIGKSGNLEETLAEDFGCVPVSENKYLHDILYLDVEGVKVQIAHHCTATGIPMNRHHPAANIATRTMFDYANRKEQPPDLILRAHMHKWYDSFDNYATRCIIGPCWQGLTHHVNRYLPGSLADCGAMIITFDNGRYVPDKVNYKREKQRWQKI